MIQFFFKSTNQFHPRQSQNTLHKVRDELLICIPTVGDLQFKLYVVLYVDIIFLPNPKPSIVVYLLQHFSFVDRVFVEMDNTHLDSRWVNY